MTRAQYVVDMAVLHAYTTTVAKAEGTLLAFADTLPDAYQREIAATVAKELETVYELLRDNRKLSFKD